MFASSQVTSGASSSSSSNSDTAVKLMVFDAVNVRGVMHSSLTSSDIERAVEKVEMVLRQLRD